MMISKSFYFINPPNINEEEFFRFSTDPNSLKFAKRFFDDCSDTKLIDGVYNLHDSSPLSVKRKFKKILSLFRQETFNDGPYYSEYFNLNLQYDAIYCLIDKCGDGYAMTGGFGFTKRTNFDFITNEIISQKYELSWVWIHPYKRNLKVFSKIWDQLRMHYGHFDVQKPYSDDMVRFLKSKQFTTD